MSKDKIIQVALRTIELETNAVSGLKDFVDADFVKAVSTIAASGGRLIVSGI
jgi:D-arabinose 5-phosphate isomerase GutQ